MMKNKIPFSNPLPDNNYAIISNQQTDPINALCEKPINSIDLMVSIEEGLVDEML